MYSLYFNCMVRTEFTDADVKNKSGLNNLTDCAGKHAVKSCRNRNKIQFFTWTLGGDHLILKGGGGLAKAGTYYLFSAWARPENWFSRIPRPEYLFSSATIFEKAKKKKKGGGGKGSEIWLRRETGQDFPCVFYFCRLPVMRVFTLRVATAHIYIFVYVNGAAACLNVHLTINNMYARYNSI